ncbi:hypothetical protein [Chryseolinea lacunae]|uniref:DUF5056 domain-containing protein n=1 Tax=Chryseolinea lacunae TaxID=2801331 RepID=A0ABS1KR25_9BACT|nr:hypothetical protein [Chryseolinea lacunae]MBL0741785.1 hypothetical protein [Chryseolinea lacunae]
MNAYEEEMQKNVEGGKPVHGDDADARSYRQVFGALKQEPDFVLPLAFADRVAQKVMQKQSARIATREYIWFGLGAVLLLAAFITAVVVTNFKFSLGVFSALKSNEGLLIFGVLFIGLLHFVDKRFIRSKTAGT